MTVLLLIIFTFWFVAVLKDILFWAYLWQLKEYRRDRIKAHFELRSSRNLLLNKKNSTLLVLLIISFLPISLVKIVVVSAALLFYGFFASRAISQLQNHTLKLPRFTPRTIVILASTVFLYGAITVAVVMLTSTRLVGWFFISDMLVPLVITLPIIALRIPAQILKKYLMRKAFLKRGKMKDLLVIGITGSYGKTSMKEYLGAILAKKFKVLKTEKNTNTEIGVAQTILRNLTNEHDVFIVEMGAYKKGEIAKIAHMTQPKIGILTGLNQQHLSLFGSMQNIQAAKYELIQALPDKGLAVFNGDNKNTRALFRQANMPKRLYTTDPLTEHTEHDIIIESVKHTPEGMEIKIRDGKEKEVIKTSLLGSHNVTNLLGAITVARSLGMEYEEIKEGIKDIKAPAHALEVKKGIKESVIIDDTYSANVDGVFAALDTIRRMNARQRICIIQPLIELGVTAEKAHREIGTRIAEACDWCIVTSPDYFPALYREALDGGMSKNNIFCIPSAREALRKAQEITDKGDVILLENRVPQELIDGLVIHGKNS